MLLQTEGGHCSDAATGKRKVPANWVAIRCIQSCHSGTIPSRKCGECYICTESERLTFLYTYQLFRLSTFLDSAHYRHTYTGIDGQGRWLCKTRQHKTWCRQAFPLSSHLPLHPQTSAIECINFVIHSKHTSTFMYMYTR